LVVAICRGWGTLNAIRKAALPTQNPDEPNFFNSENAWKNLADNPFSYLKAFVERLVS
jgi:hypothetical protein